MGNTFGQLFKVTTFGESHGPAIGVVIDGCPAGLRIDVHHIEEELSRRRPGQSKITTQRKESDTPEIISGIFEGYSTGSPIAIIIQNADQRSKDYSHIADKYRPSHADFTYQKKYGIRDYRGGGRSSARETAARVAAGAIARQFLKERDITVHAFVSQVGPVKLDKDYQKLEFGKIEDNIVRCPDPVTAEKMIEFIDQTRKNRDTVGGIITGVVKGVPAGIGEPVFDKLHADLGKAMLSINAVKGFDVGSGFEGIQMYGSEHNDIFYLDGKEIRTKTNFSGGVQGGISNGQDIYFRVAFKPVATIMKDQDTIDIHGESTIVKGKGRHDPCVVPRAVPIVEAMAAIVLVDHILLNANSAM
jgi:chorismate synthase